MKVLSFTLDVSERGSQWTIIGTILYKTNHVVSISSDCEPEICRLVKKWYLSLTRSRIVSAERWKWSLQGIMEPCGTDLWKYKKKILKAEMVDFIHFLKNYSNIICVACTMSIISYTDGLIYVGRKMKSETIWIEFPWANEKHVS